MDKKNAFTLIEIILAIAIMGIGIVGILSVFTVGAYSVNRTLILTEASFAAQMVLENYKMLGYDGISPGSSDFPSLVNSKNEKVYTEYSGTVNVQGMDTLSDLYRIDVNITRDSKSLGTFTTYIAK